MFDTHFPRVKMGTIFTHAVNQTMFYVLVITLCKSKSQMLKITLADAFKYIFEKLKILHNFDKLNLTGDMDAFLMVVYARAVKFE